MDKGIIVVDKIPQTCQHIRGNMEYGCIFGGMVCQITQNDVYHHVIDGSKPDWCPIKEIPTKLEELKQPYSIGDYQIKGFQRGWNACLEKIQEGSD